MIEVTAKPNEPSLTTVVRALLEVERGDPVLVIRTLGVGLDKPDFWSQLLQQRCGWKADTRHIDYDLSLEQQIWWEITNDPSRADSYAYSSTAQPLHTDNSWFQDPAEVNFFLMNRQASEGGAQTIYEVHHLVEDLDRLDTALLHDLTDTEIVIKKGQGAPPNRTRILRLEPDPRISWNYYRTIRDSTEVNELCERFFNFLIQAEKSGRVQDVKLRSGDCLVMADDRVLHGRRAFSAATPGERSLLQSMWRTKGTGGRG